MSSLAGHFKPGGFTYRTVPDVIDGLPKGLQHAATVVYRCIMRFLARGELDHRATDKAMADDCGWSESFVQKGLHALHVVLGEMGTPAIDRERAHGRRTIIPAPLAGRGTAGPVPDAASPPRTPPEERRDTTTGGASSSPPRIAPEDPGSRIGAIDPALVERACRLVPLATPGRVAEVVAKYGAEWVSRALDVVEKRNRKPGNKRVESWGFVLRTLKNWDKEGGPPPDPAPTPTPTAPARKAAEGGPPHPLTAAEVADLVFACQSGPPSVTQRFRARLQLAVEEGSIPPELVATIPPELLPPELLHRE
jgi:hypothetical protein